MKFKDGFKYWWEDLVEAAKEPLFWIVFITILFILITI